MSHLPDRPNAEHLRSQAKELIKAARAGDSAALARLAALAEPPFSLSHAQLAIARDYGFPSWSKLIAEVDAIRARSGIDEELAARFVQVATEERLDTLRRLLDLYPGIGTYDPACALVMGNVGYVSNWLNADNANHRLAPENSYPLEYVCYSRVGQIDPSARPGLLACATLLLDHGADPNAYRMFEGAPVPVLYAAASESSDPDLTRLLLQRGANPNDGESVYHAAQRNNREILQILVDHGADLSAAHPQYGNTPLFFLSGYRPTDKGAEEALKGIEWLLEHGADPNVPSAPEEATPLHGFAQRGWDRRPYELLVNHGADVNRKRKDGRTPFALAALTGNMEAMRVLAEHGASTGLSLPEAVVAKLASGQSTATDLSGIMDELGHILVRLAENGNAAGVKAMLAAGVPVASRGEMGATALHLACFTGRAEMVDILLEANAPLDPRDNMYDATPLGWALYAMTYMPSPYGSYPAIVRSLLKAGADESEVIAMLDREEAPAELSEIIRNRPS